MLRKIFFEIREFTREGLVTKMKSNIPIENRYALTIRQGAEYFQIGEARLRSLLEEDAMSEFVILRGNRMLIKRQLFETYLNSVNAI